MLTLERLLQLSSGNMRTGQYGIPTAQYMEVIQFSQNVQVLG